MQKTKKKLLSLLILFTLSFFSFQLKTVDAIDLSQQEGFSGSEIGTAFGNGSGDKDIKKIVVDIIKIFLTFMGVIFLAIIIFAGFKWMTSMGNSGKISEATSMMKNALIGLIIVMFSYAITLYVTRNMNRAVFDDYMGG